MKEFCGFFWFWFKSKIPNKCNSFVRDFGTKEMSFSHKLKSSNPNIFAAWWCKALIFQTLIILSISINNLKYLRSKTLGYKDIEIRKSEFVAKIQFLKPRSLSFLNLALQLCLQCKCKYQAIWKTYFLNPC